MNRKFTKVALALMAAGFSVGLAHATLTVSTATIEGRRPVLSAPTNGTPDRLGFHYSGTTGGLVVGETITLSYQYDDEDGDADNSASETNVKWFYSKDGGVTKNYIEAGVTGQSATTVGGKGSSVLTIPVEAIDATIGVEIDELSASGDPIKNHHLTVLNVHDDVTEVTECQPGDNSCGSGPGGETDVPPGPVQPNATNLVAGIYASDDTSYSTNLIGAATKLKVGKQYVFKLWLADTNNQPIGFGADNDYTDKFTYTWHLEGQSATDHKPATADMVLGTPSSDLTIPTNSEAKGVTGSDDGVQGYGLAVDFQNKPGTKMSFMVNGKSVDTAGKAQGQ